MVVHKKHNRLEFSFQPVSFEKDSVFSYINGDVVSNEVIGALFVREDVREESKSEGIHHLVYQVRNEVNSFKELLKVYRQYLNQPIDRSKVELIELDLNDVKKQIAYAEARRLRHQQSFVHSISSQIH
jgi:predicted component of type VI protein secretion system